MFKKYTTFILFEENNMEGETVLYLDSLSGCLVVECSPYTESSSLIACSNGSKALIFRCRHSRQRKYQDKDGKLPLLDEISEIDFQRRFEDNEVSSIDQFIWGPKSFLSSQAKQFCGIEFVVSKRGSISYYLSKERKESIEKIGEHDFYVNDMAFHPAYDSRPLLASVGEDFFFKVWDLENKKAMYSTLLTSTGKNVRWCQIQQNDSLLFTSDDCGVTSLRDIRTKGTVLTIISPEPTQTMDWSEKFGLLGTAGGTQWFLWDVRAGGTPIQQSSTHFESSKMITSFRWGGELSKHQPLFLTSGYGHWELWSIQKSAGVTGGVNRLARSEKSFVGQVSLYAGGPSLFTADHQKIQFISL
jgi:WD40 repeat protein